jgi:formylglycine-generating enzyme required for sulfatase activity
VRIYGDGRVQWTGLRNTQTAGSQSKQIDAGKALQLLHKTRDAKFWQLCAQYTRSVTDQIGYTVDFRIGTRNKSISDYGQSAPDFLAELAKEIDAVADTSQWINLPAPGEVRVNSKDNQRYVWIPAGTFQMGCTQDDQQCRDDEQPEHTVTISQGYWMGQTEVTVKAYKKYSAATSRAMPSTPKFVQRDLNPGWNDDQLPMLNVTWSEAGDYCSWAGLRLPSEAEWERAARGGVADGGSASLAAYAWYGNNSGDAVIDTAARLDDGTYSSILQHNQNRPHPVGEKQPNGYGLYDMLGNASEWVADYYRQTYYAREPATDPLGPQSLTPSDPSFDPSDPSAAITRVVRGGDWSQPSNRVRLSSRSSDREASHNATTGFRCAGQWP